MRIAQVTPRFHPYIGGVENVVKNISEEMVKQGHEVEVLTLDPQNIYHSYEEVDGIRIRRFSQTSFYNYSTQLFDFLKKQWSQYDVIHAHNLHSFVPHITIKATKKNYKRPLMVISGHYHGKGKTIFSNLLLHMYKPFLKRILHEFNILICVSYYEANLLTSHFGNIYGKIKVIPNGINANEIANTDSYSVEGNNILIVSRIEKYKNIQVAIKALKYLPTSYKLVVIGQGSYQKKLRKIVNRFNLNNRVKFLGRLDDKDVYKWYKTCDIVLNFSNLEAFGITALEGLAAGKPVIVNSSTALSELAQSFKNVKSINIHNMKLNDIAEEIKKGVEHGGQISKMDDYKWSAIANSLINSYECYR